LPGGHVEEGETVEQAAVRELKEETNLSATDLKQFHVYSDPKRDPRGHTISVVFTCKAKGTLKAKDDAKNITTIKISDLKVWKNKLAFDHYKILRDYKKSIATFKNKN
jgi:ADP-ribose pyrophosphatase YjhB (NUDIX family)